MKTIKDIAQTALDWFLVAGFGYDASSNQCFYTELSGSKRCALGCQLLRPHNVFMPISSWLNRTAGPSANYDEFYDEFLLSGIDLSDEKIAAFCNTLQRTHDACAQDNKNKKEYISFLLKTIANS